MSRDMSLRRKRFESIIGRLLKAAERYPYLFHVAAKTSDASYETALDPFTDDVLRGGDEARDIAKIEYNSTWESLYNGVASRPFVPEFPFRRLGQFVFEGSRWYSSLRSQVEFSEEDSFEEALSTLDELATRILAERLPDRAEKVRQSNSRASAHVSWIGILYAMTQPPVLTPEFSSVEVENGRYRLVRDADREPVFSVMTLSSNVFDVSARVLEEVFFGETEAAKSPETALREFEETLKRWVTKSGNREALLRAIRVLGAEDESNVVSAASLGRESKVGPGPKARTELSDFVTLGLFGKGDGSRGYWLTEVGRRVLKALE